MKMLRESLRLCRKLPVVFRRFIKRTLQKICLKSDPPIIVASMGRAGSTLVFDSVINAKADQYPTFFRPFYKRLITDFSWCLEGFKFSKGAVYKTHDFPPVDGAIKDCKVIYVYGPATEAVISVFGCEAKFGSQWVNRHLEHLNASESFASIYDSDVLRIEEQIKRWGRCDTANIFFLYYSDIWDELGQLQNFLGFDIQLPPRRERQSATFLPIQSLKRINNRYQKIDKRIESLRLEKSEGREY